MMPGQTGLDFASEIRRSDDVPILMLTAVGDTKDRIAGLETGADSVEGFRKVLLGLLDPAERAIVDKRVRGPR